MENRRSWQIVVLVGAVSAAAVGVAAWRTRVSSAAAAIDRASEVGSREVSNLRKLARAKLESLRAEAVRVAAARESSGHVYLARGSQFDILALARPSRVDAGFASGSWTVAWQERAPVSGADRWAGGFESTALASLPFSRARDGAIAWARVADAKGEPAFAILFEADLGGASAKRAPTGKAPEVAGGESPSEALPEGQDYGVAQSPRRAVVAAILSGNPLDGAAEAAADGSFASFLVDDRGFVAAHPNKTYRGASLATDAMVDEIVKKQRPEGAGEFVDVDGQATIGRYQAVAGTNLYAASAASIAASTAGASSQARSVAAAGGAAAALALALTTAFGPKLRRRADDDTEVDDKAPVASVSRETQNRAKESQTPRASGDRPVAPVPQFGSDLREVAEGLGAALRQPLSAVIGNAQLARRAAADTEMRERTDAIESDARAALAAIDRFARLTDSEPPRLVPTSVSDALDAAVESLRPQIAAAEVTLERRYAAAPLAMADGGLLQAAFARAIENSTHAMSRVGIRRLTLSVESEAGIVRARIVDTGPGMSRDVRERAFEPFFKAFDGPARLGLGLSFARNAFELFSGRVVLKSEPGGGTELSVEFPAVGAVIEAGGSISRQAAALINMKADWKPEPSFDQTPEPGRDQGSPLAFEPRVSAEFQDAEAATEDDEGEFQMRTFENKRSRVGPASARDPAAAEAAPLTADRASSTDAEDRSQSELLGTLPPISFDLFGDAEASAADSSGGAEATKTPTRPVRKPRLRG